MPALDIPPAFALCMHEVYGDDGDRWIAALPSLVEGLAADWGFTVEPPFELTYNYVAPVTCADGSAAVLKVGYPSDEFLREAAALRAFDGRGAVRLLASDDARGAMLIERLVPGAPLEMLPDDEQSTRIAARVMRRTWRPPPANHPFPTVSDWGDGFRRLRVEFDGGAGPFPPLLTAEAEAVFFELEASMAPPVLLHGDVHHLNILDAGEGEWRLIDAKGLIGEPAYEVGTFLQNPRRLFARPNPALSGMLARRLDILSEELGIDRERLRRWGLAQSVLSAWWSYEDHGYGYEPAILAARLLSDLG